MLLPASKRMSSSPQGPQMMSTGRAYSTICAAAAMPSSCLPLLALSQAWPFVAEYLNVPGIDMFVKQ